MLKTHPFLQKAGGPSTLSGLLEEVDPINDQINDQKVIEKSIQELEMYDQQGLNTPRQKGDYEYNGLLEVELVEAAGIQDSETLTKKDPYCVLAFGKQVYKSKILTKDSDSKWNQTFQVKTQWPLQHNLQIKVWDKLKEHASNLGSCEIALSQLSSVNDTMDVWQNLNGHLQDGKIHLKIHFVVENTNVEKKKSSKNTPTDQTMVPEAPPLPPAGYFDDKTAYSWSDDEEEEEQEEQEEEEQEEEKEEEEPEEGSEDDFVSPKASDEQNSPLTIQPPPTKKETNPKLHSLDLHINLPHNLPTGSGSFHTSNSSSNGSISSISSSNQKSTSSNQVRKSFDLDLKKITAPIESPQQIQVIVKPNTSSPNTFSPNISSPNTSSPNTPSPNTTTHDKVHDKPHDKSHDKKLQHSKSRNSSKRKSQSSSDKRDKKRLNKYVVYGVVGFSLVVTALIAYKKLKKIV